MNTIAITKNNYFDIITLINNKLLQKQKIFVQVELSDKKHDDFVIVKDKSRVSMFNQKLGGKKKEIILG